MKLVTFKTACGSEVGALTCDGCGVIPLSAIGANCADVAEFIRANGNRKAVRSAEQKLNAAAIEPLALTTLTLLAPIPRPGGIICLGLNYLEHARESARYSADAPKDYESKTVYFAKLVDEATPWNADIPLSEQVTDRLDYEVELAVILGSDCRNIAPSQVSERIFGYTVVNDVSARDVQHAHGQWFIGKSMDGFLPMGPLVITANELPFPPALDIRSYVNGEPRQHSNTADMIHGIAEVVSELSRYKTLRAGTVIATGTPSGAGMGFEPPRFLKRGDTVVCEIEGIGRLKNTVV